MNNNWRTVLRNRELASVTLHRKPAAIMVSFSTLAPGRIRGRLLAADPTLATNLAKLVSVDPKPYIHMLFRAECAESWMTSKESAVPAGWLGGRGFGNMEYFAVKVGVAPDGVDNRIIT